MSGNNLQISCIEFGLLCFNNIYIQRILILIFTLHGILVVGEMPLSILVVDDLEINRKMAALMLKKLGHQADLAENGVKAVEALERKSYDIVLMDIQMPEMDGLQATKIIREKWLNGPKIIIVTALNVSRETCLDAGADEYLAKPLRMETLRKAIERNKPVHPVEIKYVMETAAALIMSFWRNRAMISRGIHVFLGG